METLTQTRPTNARADDEYQTIDEWAASAIPGGPVTPRTVRRWIALGEGPPTIKIGRRHLIRLAAAKEWLKAREQVVA